MYLAHRHAEFAQVRNGRTSLLSVLFATEIRTTSTGVVCAFYTLSTCSFHYLILTAFSVYRSGSNLCPRILLLEQTRLVQITRSYCALQLCQDTLFPDERWFFYLRVVFLLFLCERASAGFYYLVITSDGICCVYDSRHWFWEVLIHFEIEFSWNMFL